MAEASSSLSLNSLQSFVKKLSGSNMAGPLVILVILSMMILPLPAFILDLFFTINIAMSILVLMVAVNTKSTLDFSSFPTVLLVTTLLRLSLNVASTRIVMLQGHTGTDAAGKVIEAFGHFLVGGNFTVGIVVFTILTVINFVVITKGAGRVAEVSARFALDAMPGKQMAIDADLNAGLIGEDEAKKRRADVARESEFHGSMDGASKFVHGDAVAGIVIMLINVVGGLIVGVAQHDMAVGDAAKVYTLLTIGDGLVAQIPSLIVSIAAGMVVTRISDERNAGEQVISQMFTNYKLLATVAGIIGLMGLIPGMPNIVFLLIAGALGYYAWNGMKKEALPAPPVIEKEKLQSEAHEATWSDVQPVDLLALEVGHRMVPLVDKNQPGNLLQRISSIRKKFAQDVGFLMAAIHIRDNLELKPTHYRILLKGVEVGQGEALVGKFLAINPGGATNPIEGIETQDPAFGLPAVWIEAPQRERAQNLGYTVVDAATVVGTHLNQVISSNAAELLGRQEVQQLLQHIAKEMPQLVEDFVPKSVPLGVFHKVLQNLLEEGVSIRDMRTIIETISDMSTRIQNPDELTTYVRMALSKSIVQSLIPNSDEIHVMSLDPNFERTMIQAVTGNGANHTIEPHLADTLVRETGAAAQRQEELGLQPILMVPPVLRLLFSKFLRRSIPQLKVLSYNEVPEDKQIKVTSVIGGGKS